MSKTPNEDSSKSQPPESQPPESEQVSKPGEVAKNVDKKQMAQFVTTIKNAEQQVGEHIINALQHDDTVAVITTVVIGPDGLQRVVSAALDPKRMEDVQEILQAATEEREDEEPCVGFHCLVKPKAGGDNTKTS